MGVGHYIAFGLVIVIIFLGWLAGRLNSNLEYQKNLKARLQSRNNRLETDVENLNRALEERVLANENLAKKLNSERSKSSRLTNELKKIKGSVNVVKVEAKEVKPKRKYTRRKKTTKKE